MDIISGGPCGASEYFLELGVYQLRLEADDAGKAIYEQAALDGFERAGVDAGGDGLEVFADGGLSAGNGVVGVELFDEPVPLELEDVDGGVEQLLEFFFAGGEEEIAGVLAPGDEGELDVDSLGEADVECPCGGLDAGGVTVEDEDDFFCVSSEEPAVAGREAGA